MFPYPESLPLSRGAAAVSLIVGCLLQLLLMVAA
jgi:hypothetical protein